MRKIILSALGVLIIVAAYFGTTSIINSKQSPVSSGAKLVKTVFADTVTNGDVPIVIAANGNLMAKRRVELFSEVQGIFKGGSKLFKTGQQYSKGETLIRINSDEYRANVQSAKSNYYNQLTAVMPDLRLDFPEVYSKWETYLSSFNLNSTTPTLPELTSEKEKYFISGRGILTGYYTVKNLEQRLSKYSIATPFSGVLTEALVTEGSLVRAGQKLGEFIATDVYELEVSVSKTYADLLKLNASVTLTNLDKTKSYIGKVTRINGRIDMASQTIKAFIEVRDSGLKEGMFLEAQLNAITETNAIEISRSLLLENNEIFIVNDTILETIPVSPVYFSDKTVVLKNVPNGAVIISKPLTGAYAGMLVKIFSDNKSINTAL